ncbi:PEGA domain-containing protein [Candidatus Saccharibacteria bacterium]|nr:PEGA domain-containing protein [Candidatus Saccharibacteria bacterium]
MYRAPSKRHQLIKRIAVYSLMTLGVTLLVTFLVFIMLGFRFNRSTSSIQQGGLVQFASRPIDARVTVGKAELKDSTPSKITMNPGNYDVSMKKTGYHDWVKNVDVVSGEVLWLNYTQLVPTDIKTEQLNKFETLSQAKSAPNGDRYALITDSTKPVVSFLDITGSVPKQDDIAIPTALIPADKTPVYDLVEWANDSDRILVTMSYDGVVDRLLVDRRNADRTVNISKDYAADIAAATFDPRSSERVIIRTANGDIRLIDTANNSLSSVLASNVSTMSLYDNDAILVVQPLAEGGQSIGYLSLGSSEVRELKRIASAEKTTFAVAEYFNEPHIAVATGAQLDIYKVNSLPSSKSDAVISMTNVHSVVLPATVEYLSIRTGGRFVVAQYAGGLQTYDIELNKQVLTAFKAPVVSELRWLDKYHFYVTSGTDLQVMEFDGSNAHLITALATTFDAVQSDDGKFIYSLQKTDTGFALQRSRMILEN